MHSTGVESNGNDAGMHEIQEQFRHPMSLEEVHIDALVRCITLLCFPIVVTLNVIQCDHAVQEESA